MHLGQRGADWASKWARLAGLGQPAWAHLGPVHGLICPVLLLESSRVCLLTCIWTAWLLILSLTSRSLVAMVHLHMFGNLALELGSIEIVFGKFLYT
jgi:hypothetical protein